MNPNQGRKALIWWNWEPSLKTGFLLFSTKKCFPLDPVWLLLIIQEPQWYQMKPYNIHGNTQIHMFTDSNTPFCVSNYFLLKSKLNVSVLQKKTNMITDNKKTYDRFSIFNNTLSFCCYININKHIHIKLSRTWCNRLFIKTRPLSYYFLILEWF